MRNLVYFLISFFFFSLCINGQLTVKDNEKPANTIMEVIDEGNAASILLPPLSSTLTGSKLYNSNGSLYWGTNKLGFAGSSGGWTDGGNVVYTTTSTDKVGIGIESPSHKLQIHDIASNFAYVSFTNETTGSSDGNGVVIGLDASEDLRLHSFESNNIKFFTNNAEQVRINSLGNVGIGTDSPTATLHVQGNDGILFTGNLDEGTIPMEGAGTRMMWYPKKAAFRAGAIAGAGSTYWNADSIGSYSIAVGFNNKAKGRASIAMGNGTKAIGSHSTAMGSLTIANSYESFVIGRYNIGGGDPDEWIETDPLFEIGNGNSINRNNALTVLKNGNLGIGTDSPTATLHVQGNDGILFTGNLDEGTIPMEGAGTRMMWYPKKAAFRAGSVSGIGSTYWNDENIGEYSVSIGYITKAEGDYSFSSGWNSHALQDYTTAIGQNNMARGYASTAFGITTNARSYNSFAIGRMNIGNGNSDSWILTDPLFEIGNGDYENGAANALTVLKNGNIGVGIETPSYKLQVHEKSSDHAYMSFSNETTDYTSGNGVLIGIDPAEDFRIHSYEENNIKFFINNGEKVRIASNGNFGIGTTSPDYKLEVNGDAAKTSGGTVWVNSSDKRLKDIHGNYEKGLDEIISLQPKRFSYKEGNPRNLPSDTDEIGFIAQEVREIFPESVNEGKDGYLDFNMHPVNVAMVNAIKAQQEIIEELKQRIVNLEKEIIVKRLSLRRE